MTNCYQTLGLTEKATLEEIKKSYRRRVMMYHPDRNKSSDASNRFFEIQSAYDLLINNQLRAHYNLQLRSNFSQENETQKQTNDYKKNSKANKKPRDINSPFEYYSFGNYLDYFKNIEVSMRLFILSVPGFIESIIILSEFANDYNLNVVDYIIECPFLTYFR